MALRAGGPFRTRRRFFAAGQRARLRAYSRVQQV